VIGVIGRVSPESKLRLRRGGVNDDDENDYDYDYVYTTVARPQRSHDGTRRVVLYDNRRFGW
jgi:hypothetical protein